MNRLFLNRVYLPGAIDNAKDFGIGWRQMIQEKLSGLDLIFLDPCHKPMLPEFACEDLENHPRRLKLKQQGDFETLAHEMRIIRSIDLRFCDLCDFAIAHLDLDTYTTGTTEEITTLNRRKVPILIHVEQGKSKLPDWYLGTLPYQHVFGEWENLIQYIKHIAYDAGPIETLNRWRFLDYGKLHGMTMIPLSKEKTAIISPEDFLYLSKWNWCVIKEGKNKWRAMRKTSSNTTRYMHQDIAQRLGWNNVHRLVLDHINGDSLDNRRENLRCVTLSQNGHNRGSQCNSKTGIKGVWFDKKVNKYAAEITVDGKKHWLGHFATLIDAQIARNTTNQQFIDSCIKPS